MPWEGPHDYPAINGLTKYIRITCANFGVSCNKRDVCIISNQWIGDIMHPVHVSGKYILIRSHFVNNDNSNTDVAFSL